MDEVRRKKRLTVGILTELPRPRGRYRTPIGPQTISFRGLQEEGRRHGIRVFVFRPRGVNWTTGMVNGWIWSRRRRRWTAVRTPIPPIVYNRVPRRSLDRTSQVRSTIRRLRARKVLFFNEGFFDKGWVYRVLTEHPDSRPHLPPTRPVRAHHEVFRALEAHGPVFLKPVNGTRGRGLLYLEQQGPRVRWQDTRVGTPRRGISRARRLGRTLNRLMNRRRYVVQQAVNRARYKNRPFDVRTLVQRADGGRWVVTGMAARVAGRGRVATQESQGGFSSDLDPVLRGSFPESMQQELYDELERVALTTARVIQEASPHLVVEMSIDLTLDPGGKVWIIECNAKPMAFVEEDIMARHRKLMIRFIRYLSRQTPDTARRLAAATSGL